MHYRVQTVGSYNVVYLEGEVDLQHSPRAREQILSALGRDCSVLVDLSAVEYIDSSGIASLVEGLRVAKNRKLQFGLVDVSKPARQVLELARLDKVFQIHDSVSDLVTGQGD